MARLEFSQENLDIFIARCAKFFGTTNFSFPTLFSESRVKYPRKQFNLPFSVLRLTNPQGLEELYVVSPMDLNIGTFARVKVVFPFIFNNGIAQILFDQPMAVKIIRHPDYFPPGLGQTLETIDSSAFGIPSAEGWSMTTSQKSKYLGYESENPCNPQSIARELAHPYKHYRVMPLYPGIELFTFLQKVQNTQIRLTPDAVLYMMYQLLCNLRELHLSNRIHGDIKIENIIINYELHPNTRVKSFKFYWIDFDLSKPIGSWHPPFGTPDCMAPEMKALINKGQIQVSPALDIYSLGTVFDSLAFVMTYPRHMKDKYAPICNFICLTLIPAMMSAEPLQRASLEQCIKLCTDYADLIGITFDGTPEPQSLGPKGNRLDIMLGPVTEEEKLRLLSLAHTLSSPIPVSPIDSSSPDSASGNVSDAISIQQLTQKRPLGSASPQTPRKRPCIFVTSVSPAPQSPDSPNKKVVF